MAHQPPLTLPTAKRRKIRRWPFVLAGAGALAGALVMVFVVWNWASDAPPIPDRDALWQMRRTPGVRFLDHDGAFIAARGAKYGARVGLQQLPEVASQGVV